MKISNLKKNILVFCAIVSLNIQAQQTKKTSEKPNIILVIVDQFRADASKREGFELNTTPFLDSLAQAGTWFNRAYCAMPACTPSRTSMFTGRFPSATHVNSNMNLQDAFFTKDIFDVVKSKGYKTALVGKNHTYLQPKDVDFWADFNHLGSGNPETQEEKDFNTYMRSTNFYMSEDPAPFPASSQMPAKIVKTAEGWVDQVAQEDAPFFLYVSIPEPHNPYQVSEPYYSMFPPESLPEIKTDTNDLYAKGNTWVLERQLLQMGYGDYQKMIPRIRSNYYGMMRLIDDQLQGLMQYIDKKNPGNTIFIFVSDHGDYVGEYGLIKKGVGVPESLTRIPMIWHGPGIVKNRMPSAAHVSNVDIMPTICDLLGVGFPDGVQGRSLLPILQGKDYPKDEFSSIIVQQGYGGLPYVDFEEYDPYRDDGTIAKGKIMADELNTWTQSGRLRMLRKGDWKLVYDQLGHGRMYNIKDDPAGVDDLYESNEYQTKKTELFEDMMRWELRTQDPLPMPHPNANRKYGFKKDPRNHWAPYKDEAEDRLKRVKNRG